MEIGLNDLQLGRSACVIHITDNPLTQMLKNFGLVLGTKICCRYRTPGGSVTAVRFRGTTVALRTRDMAAIRVRVQ